MGIEKGKTAFPLISFPVHTLASRLAERISDTPSPQKQQYDRVRGRQNPLTQPVQRERIPPSKNCEAISTETIVKIENTICAFGPTKPRKLIWIGKLCNINI